jgi:hypothetical protein
MLRENYSLQASRFYPKIYKCDLLLGVSYNPLPIRYKSSARRG